MKQRFAILALILCVSFFCAMADGCSCGTQSAESNALPNGGSAVSNVETVTTTMEKSTTGQATTKKSTEPGTTQQKTTQKETTKPSNTEASQTTPSETTKPSSTTTQVTPEDIPLAGGWQTYRGYGIPANAQAAFDKAIKGYVGMKLTPKKLIATQVVAGTNYKFLCDGTGVYPGAKTKEYVVVIYQDLSGNCTISSVTEV